MLGVSRWLSDHDVHFSFVPVSMAKHAMVTGLAPVLGGRLLWRGNSVDDNCDRHGRRASRIVVGTWHWHLGQPGGMCLHGVSAVQQWRHCTSKQGRFALGRPVKVLEV